LGFARLRLEAIAAAFLMPDGSAKQRPPVGVGGNRTSIKGWCGVKISDFAVAVCPMADRQILWICRLADTFL
jgi:hypothetical protein